MAQFKCPYCGVGSPIYERKGPHIGEWCSFCKRWIRWMPKKEATGSVIKSQLDAQDFKDETRRYATENTKDTEDTEVPWL